MLVNTIFQEKPALNQNNRTKCKDTTLKTNLLRLRINNKIKTVYIYSIEYDSTVPKDNTFIKRIILRNIRHELQEAYEKNVDTGDNLFSTKMILEDKVFLSKVIIEEEEKIYQVIIKLVKNQTLDLLQEIDNNDTFYEQKKYFVEVLIKNILNANKLSRVRRIYFDRNKPREFNYNGFSGNLYCGYQTAAKIAEKGLFLSLSVKFKIINKKSCFEKIREINGKSASDYLRKLKECFVGRTVQANYGKYAFYKIDDVSIDKNVTNTTIRRQNSIYLLIKEQNGNMEEITLFQYYRESYEKTVSEQTQPLFISIRKNPLTDKEDNIFLVPELMLMTGLDDDLRDNDRVKRDMISYTKLNPIDRVNKIQEFRELAYKTNMNMIIQDKRTGLKRKLPEPNDIRLEWGLEINPNTLEVKGRILPNPEIQGQRNAIQLNKGRIVYRDSQIFNPLKLEKNKWILFYNSKNDNEAYKLIDNFQKCSRGIGISVEDPYMIKHKCRNEEEILDELDRISNLPSYKIILVILTKFEKSYYRIIKNKLITNYGIPSQVVIKENVANQNLSYFTNVLLQMNYKLGGELFTISNLHNAIKNKSMVVGLDCTKIVGSKERNFVMVSSLDSYCSKYYTSIQSSSQGSNISPAVSLLLSALNKYEKFRQSIPEYIFIYRSGSSEKEKRLIMDLEVKALINALSEKRPNNPPKLCFIIVNKKTEMKFFEGERNPSAGTVVDTACVNPFIYEFYLQPQDVNSGTATPTNFHVLYDTTKIPCEILQECTYQLCYYYFNWNGPIRVPAPLKYAEVCNKFISSNLTSEVESEKLKSSAFYI